MGDHRREPPRSEDEFAQFFELSLDPLCIASFAGYFARLNPALERAFGRRGEELRTRPFYDFIHPDDRQRTGEAMAALAQGDDIVEFENRIVRPDGEVRWLQWSTRTSVERRIVYAVARDVTERRRADAELARLAEEQAALRRVATLVARGVSQSTLFEAVAAEVGKLFRADLAGMIRYLDDQTITPVATWAPSGAHPPVTGDWALEGDRLATAILESRQPIREDHWADVSGPIAEFVREVLGIRSSVGSPVIVEGEVWGAVFVHSTSDRLLPDSTESRLVSFTELVATAISNTQARADVTASRARIVVAGDEERRRVVRDLHDGAQQRLVHMTLLLKQASEALEPGGEPSAELVNEALRQSELATDELRELARGILPSVIAHGGLSAGIKGLARRVPVPVQVDVAVGRLPPAVESTAYFVVAEALTNVAKHARAGSAEVMAWVEDGTLTVQVSDDGVGGARLDGSGLVGLADRLAALDGRLRVASQAGAGTLVAAAIPIAG